MGLLIIVEALEVLDRSNRVGLMGLKYGMVTEEEWVDYRGEEGDEGDKGWHFQAETWLQLGQTLVGELEAKEYRFAKKDAGREIDRMGHKVVSIIFDPYGDDDSEVVVKTLVGTCPFCGVSRELKNPDWEREILDENDEAVWQSCREQMNDYKARYLSSFARYMMRI